MISAKVYQHNATYTKVSRYYACNVISNWVKAIELIACEVEIFGRMGLFENQVQT
jgi:hypothetical protein